MILVKILLYCLCLVVVGVQGVDRVTQARALIGSTAYTINTNRAPSQTEAPSDGGDDSEDDGKSGPNTNSGYNYINAAELKGKTPTELAVWYLQKFPDSAHTNEAALREFHAWLDEAAKQNANLKDEFDEAVEYLKAHPEIVNPPQASEEPDESGKEDVPTETSNPSSTANPSTTTTPSPGGTTPVAPGGATTPTPTAPVATASPKYPHLDTTTLGTATAAEVANYVYQKFAPGSTWDYPALTEMYNWLDEKGESDPAFKATVFQYLEIMGWAE